MKKRAASTERKTNGFGIPFQAVESIQYQEGAVVSRTLYDTREGTVTLFAFAAGQGLSEHTSPYNAIVYCLEGAVDIHISGRSTIVASGGMIIMPAHEPHSLKAISAFKMVLVLIRNSNAIKEVADGS